MRLPINLFLLKRHLAFKQNSQYLKHNYKKGVVSLIRNTLVILNPERVVSLNRNQVVSLSGISTGGRGFESRHPDKQKALPAESG
jgi:hypothetical protein